MAKLNLKDTLTVPEGVEVIVETKQITVRGPKGELSRKFYSPAVKIISQEKMITFEIKNSTKREKMIMKTIKAHVKNMMHGVIHGFEYHLRVCSGHFPMTVSYDKGEVIVKNFLGESIPRKTKIPNGIEVNIKGNEITVNGMDREVTGQAAAKIEAITRMTNKDRRRFQDGVFIVKKAGSKS